MRVKAFYFFSDWDNNPETKKKEFVEECKSHNMRYELIDVESEQGVNLSIKYGVRNVPTIIFMHNNNVLEKVAGNKGYLKIKNYCK